MKYHVITVSQSTARAATGAASRWRVEGDRRDPRSIDNVWRAELFWQKRLLNVIHVDRSIFLRGQ